MSIADYVREVKDFVWEEKLAVWKEVVQKVNTDFDEGRNKFSALNRYYVFEE